MENGFFAVDDQGVACIIAALKPHDDIRFVGEKVDHFPLAFIPPLGPDDRDVCHFLRFWICDFGWESKIQNRKSDYSFTKVAETICGRARSSLSAFLPTTSSTWVKEIALPPLSLRPSSMPAMFIPLLPSMVPTAPTTPGTSLFCKMRIYPSGTASR